MFIIVLAALLSAVPLFGADLKKKVEEPIDSYGWMLELAPPRSSAEINPGFSLFPLVAAPLADSESWIVRRMTESELQDQLKQAKKKVNSEGRVQCPKCYKMYAQTSFALHWERHVRDAKES